MQQVKYIEDVNAFLGVLESKTAIRDYAYILHDKDVDEQGKQKEPHYHIAIRFKDTVNTKYVAQWFGIQENYVGRIKGRWTDVLKYLIHGNASEKYQYSAEEVTSNFDWLGEVVKADARKSGQARKEQIINSIVDGTIREYNYTDYISAIEYDKYSRSIEGAFKYRLNVIKERKRDMEAIFINGRSGTGKTTYAKKLAEDKGYSYFVSSSSNDVLDGYQGQDCVILDDLRGSSVSLSDLLKMLDNHTSSTVKSRYKNKVLECKLIIITTVSDIDTFFANVFENEEEPIHQLKRRCQTYIRFDAETMDVYFYDEAHQDYYKAASYVNPILSMFTFEVADKKAIDERLSSMFGDDLKKLDDAEVLPSDFIPLDDQTVIPFDKE